ncbi:hypothetical protein NDU88_008302 [Pleurodeles waltl]|uniref:Uncharacterized protein n=1 Tax=Pleurodeles waltl TaxID=8319 RepID=A0AAV7NYL5_PLEWA|nr:hypothetical protein NDU88_008302 [Pleurodeles waltl]
MVCQLIANERAPESPQQDGCSIVQLCQSGLKIRQVSCHPPMSLTEKQSNDIGVLLASSGPATTERSAPRALDQNAQTRPVGRGAATKTP